MSGKRSDGALDCLRSEGSKLVNVKFFRGNADLISTDQFREELCASVERRRAAQKSGKQGAFPKTKGKTLDLRKLVADMT